MPRPVYCFYLMRAVDGGRLGQRSSSPALAPALGSTCVCLCVYFPWLNSYIRDVLCPYLSLSNVIRSTPVLTATRYPFQSVTAPSARLEHPAGWVQENACLEDSRGRTAEFATV